MSLTKIFKDSINYPFKDWSKLIILGVLIFIPTILAALTRQFPGNALEFITGIFMLLISFTVEGYGISVIKNTIEGSNTIPDFDWDRNFTSGLKLFVVEIIYMIGIGIIFGIVLFITKGFDLLPDLFKFNMNHNVPISIANMTSVADPAINTTITVLHSASPLLIIGLIIVMILAIIAMFFMIISTCRLAKTNSIKEALSWRGITGDIKTIGIGRLIAWYILLVIVVAILVLIATIILFAFALIPVVGAIIGAIIFAFIFSPFIALLSARAMGLLYASA